MAADDKRMRVLGAALRDRFQVRDDLPLELQCLLLRLLLQEDEKSSRSRLTRA
jgi:hypothetical protein